MSSVSLGPTPFPELTHIMIGLESCSFLVSPGRLRRGVLGRASPPCGPGRAELCRPSAAGGGLPPFRGAEHDDGRRRLLLGRWAWQGHVHQALPQRAQQVGWVPSPAASGPPVQPSVLWGLDTFLASLSPRPSQAPLDVQRDLLPPQLRGHGPSVHSRQRRPQTGEGRASFTAGTGGRRLPG